MPDEEGKTRTAAMGMLMAELPLRMGLEACIELEQLAAADGDTEVIDYMFKPGGNKDGD